MKRDKNRPSEGRQRRDAAAQAGDAVEPQVRQAVRSLGWTIPQSEEEVAAAERRWAGDAAQLPDSIRAPAAVGGPSPVEGGRPSTLLQFPASEAVETMLARAAREGGGVSPEVEERMRRGRKAAEEKARKCGEDEDGRRDGPDVR